MNEGNANTKDKTWQNSDLFLGFKRQDQYADAAEKVIMGELDVNVTV